jgi:large conductance mechanosensitive channel
VSVIQDFKNFLISGNLVQLAVAFVTGMALTALIGSLVTNVIDPLIGVFFNANLANIGNPTVNGSQFHFGAFLAGVINFVVLMAVLFFLIVYPIMESQKRKAAKQPAAAVTTRPCPACCSTIALQATRCPFCTTDVVPLAPAKPAPAAPAAAASS